MSRGAEAAATESRQTVLNGTSFHGAILDKTDFRGVDLSNACGMTIEQLEAAITDDNTILPQRLDLREVNDGEDTHDSSEGRGH